MNNWQQKNRQLAQCQRGSSGIYLIMFIITTLFLIIALGFGVWAFASRTDYKNNSDQKAAQAVEVAKQEQEARLRAEFAEEIKKPYEAYITPDQFGSVRIVYPRTWSAYVVEQSGGGQPIDAYFHPGYVPSATSSESFALRFQVTSRPLADEMIQYDSAAQQGKVKVSAFRAKNVNTDKTGYRVDGEYTANRRGSVILLPLRDKTIKIWTESEEYTKDLNQVVLASLSYDP